MLIFHGSFVNGEAMVNTFVKLAKKRGFIIVAPDSSSELGWLVGDTPDEVTIDYEHAVKCLNEILGIKGVSVSEKMLSIGISAGGSTAAFFGTHDTSFSHMAISHGGIIASGLGEHILKTWLSTGISDTLRTTKELQGYIPILSELGFSSVTYNEYDYGHDVKGPEKIELVDWWLE